MKTIIELAREAGLADSAGVVHAHFQLERFAALVREAVIAELVAGSGEPALLGTKEINMADDLEGIYGYTANQLAGAVARERERCAKVCDGYAKNSSNPMNFAENCADAIRSLK